MVTRPAELFWGDRGGASGNVWWVQERLGEPTPEEIGGCARDPKYSEGMAYVRSSLGPALPAPE